MNPSLPPSYFEALYATDPDPWRFASSDYEAEKYAATLAALPAPRYRAALEIGCSIGVLTAELAPSCDDLLAIDVVEAALNQARHRNAAHQHVRFERAAVPAQWPRGRFDLILFSEVLYYLDDTDAHATARLAATAIQPGGAVLLVHWTGPTNYPRSGDQAAEAFIAATAGALIPRRQARTAQYRLDLLECPAPTPTGRAP